jgi:glucose/arabinose dehydrogenase
MYSANHEWNVRDSHQVIKRIQIVNRYIKVLVGLLLLNLVINACGLIPSENQGQPTFVPVAPASPTVDVGSIPSPVTTYEGEGSPTTPVKTPLTELPPAADPTEAAFSFPYPSSFPDPAKYDWQMLTGDLSRPVGLTHVGDGSGRLFVLEQEGLIRIVQGRELLAEPFLDIRDRVGSNANEQGLLGLAFHPQYPQNGYLYVNYTDLNGGTVIARYSVSADPGLVDPGSEVRLLQIPQPYGNHNGGALAFGPDGYLYIGTGDGGSGGDPLGNGQSLDTLLGKILRIDVDNGDPYTNPEGNLEGEIWANGLRNPWRFSFDRLTGDLYIGDVGQGDWEEINYLATGSPGGANFGWNFREGAHPFAGSPPAGLELIDPVAEYDHSLGISVTGGVVYRGGALPGFYGTYLYGDYGSGRVWGLFPDPDGGWKNQILFESGANITSFGEDEDGEVYLVDHKGFVFKLVERE